ncbi:nonstructural protein [Microviridae sp.]|nr:nonstructural protein [Microviridae sp.]
MKLNAYVIFDKTAGIYNKPFYQVNDATALRIAKSMSIDPQSQLSKNPSDFAMFRTGTYDDETAQFEQIEMVRICHFHEIQSQAMAERSQFEIEMEIERQRDLENQQTEQTA